MVKRTKSYISKPNITKRSHIHVNHIHVNQTYTWDSGLKIYKPVISIPEKVKHICKVIQNHVGSSEFSVLFKGDWNFDDFRISEEYIIPKQKVSGSSVDYKEDLTKYKKEGFNVVIHSHPFSLTSFSHTDEEHINVHFDVSVLFCRGEFTDATMRIKLKDGILKLKPEIKMISEIPVIPIDGLDNIEKFRLPDTYLNYHSALYPSSYHSQSSRWWDDEEEE